MAECREPLAHVATHWSVAIREALLGGVSVAEARIAAALHIRPELGKGGTRALELGSGISRTVVCRTVPAEADTSHLLVCRTRGSSDFTETQPMEVELRRRHSVDHRSLTTYKGFTPVQETPAPNPNVVQSGLVGVPHTPSRAPGTRSADVLDPRMDVWSNSRQSCQVGRAGDHGWVLAVVYGLAPVEVPLAEVRELLGLSERGAYAALARLAEQQWVTKLRRGREVYVRIDFSELVANEEMQSWTDRAQRRFLNAWHERQQLKRRRDSVEGFEAWKMTRRAKLQLAALPPDADPQWRAVLEREDPERAFFERVQRAA